MMQAKWGSHGDYQIIALAPNSPQEIFDLTIQAFNFAEQYRCPVLVMSDECVGHMTEKVVIPPREKVERTMRRYTKKKPGEYLPYQWGKDEVPDIVKAGDGYRFHVTGLTHDERGYPVINAEAQEWMVKHLRDKIQKNKDNIIMLEELHLDEAEVVVVSYGISSRVAHRAMELAREEGLKAGMLRMVTCWPFCEEKIRELAERVKAFVTVEVNMGQMALEVERCAGGKAGCYLVPHAGGDVHNPEDILEVIKEAAK
jgi:2-oxoglutarate ferredoxin oxidoreductase subunit alpha